MLGCVGVKAQDMYSNDVECLSVNDRVAVIRASGLAEKKKEACNMTLKSIFNALFVNGVDGIQDGKPLVEKEDSYYMEQFFTSRYQVFLKDYRQLGETKKQPSKLYKADVEAQVLIGALIDDLVRNKLMKKPLEQVSMEETQEQIALPSIMVVPYKKNEGVSYSSILRNDYDLRMAVSAVDNGFIQRGVHTVSMEGKLAATARASEWEADRADSNDKQLLMNSGADVYVIVDLKKDISASAGSRVSLIMTARETATGRNLASKSGWTNRFHTTELDKLCAYAVQDVLDKFLKDITFSFVENIVKGNSVYLRVSLADDAMVTLESRVGGNVSIASRIRSWVRQNAQGGRYHLQGSVAESLIFDSIQIPSRDIDGLPMDAATFADNLAIYLEEIQVSCDVRIDGNAIYVTLH